VHTCPHARPPTYPPPHPHPSRTKWTRRVPHPVLIGHAASLSQAAPKVRSAVQASITDMIKAVGPESPTLLSLLADVPAGAEVLVLAFVRTLTEGGERHGTLVAAIKALYARSGDARFMIYICASLPRAELEALLPKIVALPAVRPAPPIRPPPPPSY
jgi:hypothetical protein